MQFKWRVIYKVDNTIALHLVSEDTYSLSNHSAIDLPAMKAAIIKSFSKVKQEFYARTKEEGNRIIVFNVSDELAATSHKDFCEAFKTLTMAAIIIIFIFFKIVR